MKLYLFNILVALSQLGNTILGGLTGRRRNCFSERWVRDPMQPDLVAVPSYTAQTDIKVFVIERL